MAVSDSPESSNLWRPPDTKENRHAIWKGHLKDKRTNSIQESYDRVADEYTRRIFNELEHKPFDRELLNRFAAEVRDRGEVCDMGCGPGHVARYLYQAGTKVFGIDLSPRMIENARTLSPELVFRVGN